VKRLQKTIEQPVHIAGVGINTGEDANVWLKPGPVGSGVVFIRTDLPGKPEIPATHDNVASRLRRTALQKGDPQAGGAEIQLVEHALAALHGMHIDNAVVEIDGPEMPVGDGSANIYVDAIEEAGIVEQDRPRREVVITEPISISAKDASIVALPSEDGMRVSEKDIEELRSRGMGKGATYQNTLVFGPEGIVQNTLRFDDEPCRHKILDIIGDLSLAGVDINAHIIGIKSGHALNVRLAERIRRILLERAAPPKAAVFDVRAIQKVLPHRYPFLLVDRLIELVDDRRAVGIKNVSINEEFFQGHWPDQPIMPGVLQIEALAQVGGLIFAKRCLENNKLAVLLGVDKAKFRRTVVPGDQLILEVEATRTRSRTALVHGRAMVGPDVACEADISYMLVEKPADTADTEP